MTWLVAAGIGAIILLAAAVWWWWPKWEVVRFQIPDPKARGDLEDNFRKTIGQLIGGAAVLAGAGLAYYQTQLTLQASNNQLKASRDQLISQQVSKGFEQLGSKDNITVRLGGIYALEGVMNTSEQYHQPVLEALCAFVRDATKNVKGEEPPTTDIQAALTVIGRRAGGEGEVDLERSHIPKATLVRAHLSGATLTDAHLSLAHLSGANLSGANLTGAYLSGANLILANLSLANLSDANLTGAYLSRADLTDAYLIGADLSDANLIRADLTGAYLSLANLTGAYLSGATLTDAHLSGADLSGADGLNQNQLNKACGNSETKLPPRMTIKVCPEDVH